MSAPFFKDYDHDTQSRETTIPNFKCLCSVNPGFAAALYPLQCIANA